MKFFTPIIQSIIAAILLAVLGGAWRVYADVQDVKIRIKNVGRLGEGIEAIRDELSALSSSVKAIEKRVDRRLADVPLCRRE